MTLSRSTTALLVLLLGACGDGEPAAPSDGGGTLDAALDAALGVPRDGGELDATLDDGGLDAGRVDEDAGAEDAGLVDDAATSEDAGEGGAPAMPCDALRPCQEGLVCVPLAPSHTVGFCAPTCTVLHTTCGYFGPGVHAECSLELDDGTLACGFVCVLDHGDHAHDYRCPSGDWGRLRCERAAGAFGHRYCAPSQE